MIDALLLLHIFGAFVVAVFTILGIVDAKCAQWARLPMRARGMTLGLLFEIASGSVLSLIASTFSLFEFCRNIGIYTTIILGSMFYIYMKLAEHKREGLFPSRFVVSGLVLSACATLPVFIVAV